MFVCLMCFFVKWKQKGNSDEWGNDLKIQEWGTRKDYGGKNDKISQLKEIWLPFPHKYWDFKVCVIIEGRNVFLCYAMKHLPVQYALVWLFNNRWSRYIIWNHQIRNKVYFRFLLNGYLLNYNNLWLVRWVNSQRHLSHYPSLIAYPYKVLWSLNADYA